MVASEIVDIKEAKLKCIQREIETHVFSYDERLHQLKHDLTNRWVPGCEAMDLKTYFRQVGKEQELKPEELGQLDEFDNGPEDFKDTLMSVANLLNQSNKTHIILIDEVDLKNVISNSPEKYRNVLDVDLSYVTEYENVHFIFCLRPASYGNNNFTISCMSQQSNQRFFYLQNVHRNAGEIQKLIRNFQNQIDPEAEGHPKMEEVMDFKKLPPPLKPPDFKRCVIWIPTIQSVEDDALEKIDDLLSSIPVNDDEIAILHTNKNSKVLARKLKQRNKKRSGPHEDINYNGGEADVVVFITDGSLNIQTLARTRRMLIIMTCEKFWNSQNPLMLKNTVSEGLVEMIRLEDCPYEMIECDYCGIKFDDTKFQYHRINCLKRLVCCSNINKGCEWEGCEDVRMSHESLKCSFGLEICEYCQGHFFRHMIGKHKNEECPDRPANCNKCAAWNGKEKEKEKHVYKECPDRHVSCPNDGCQWKGEAKEHSKHVPLCQFETEICGQGNCELSITQLKMKQHKQKECAGRPFYKKGNFVSILICKSKGLLIDTYSYISVYYSKICRIILPIFIGVIIGGSLLYHYWPLPGKHKAFIFPNKTKKFTLSTILDTLYLLLFGDNYIT